MGRGSVTRFSPAPTADHVLVEVLLGEVDATTRAILNFDLFALTKAALSHAVLGLVHEVRDELTEGERYPLPWRYRPTVVAVNGVSSEVPADELLEHLGAVLDCLAANSTEQALTLRAGRAYRAAMRARALHPRQSERPKRAQP